MYVPFHSNNSLNENNTPRNVYNSYPSIDQIGGQSEFNFQQQPQLSYPVDGEKTSSLMDLSVTQPHSSSGYIYGSAIPNNGTYPVVQNLSEYQSQNQLNKNDNNIQSSHIEKMEPLDGASLSEVEGNHQFENSVIDATTDNNSESPNSEAPSNGIKKYLPPNEKIRLNEKNFFDKWRNEYDSELIKLVPRYKNDWKKIAKKIKSLYNVKATPHFLRNYFSKLTADQPKCPSINFTRKLDATIAFMVNKHGLVWVKIAEEMDISDPMKIKNRYYSQIKKKDLFDELLEEAKEFMEASDVKQEDQKSQSPKSAEEDNNNDAATQNASTATDDVKIENGVESQSTLLPQFQIPTTSINYGAQIINSDHQQQQMVEQSDIANSFIPHPPSQFNNFDQQNGTAAVYSQIHQQPNLIYSSAQQQQQQHPSGFGLMDQREMKFEESYFDFQSNTANFSQDNKTGGNSSENLLF